MGSFITLGLGKLEIDWGKNDFFRHHSQLYLPSDICQIPYYYADEVVEEKEGLSSSLDDVCQRLELMGYADRQLRVIYERHFSDVPSYHSIPQLSFDEFQRILTSVDISNVLATRDDPAFFDQGELASDGLFQNIELKKFLPEGFSIDREAGLVLESLDPYLILKVLGQNPLNRKEMVQ